MDRLYGRRRRWHRRLVLSTVLSLVASVLAVASAAPAQAATTTTIDGRATGRVFDGVGAISGGGGNSRLLFDYPEPQRGQLLDYLFAPGQGAAVQLLKVEVGGDTNSTSGAEPSHEHTRGVIDCNRGYEWWLMEQAKARNPNVKLAALSWGAPGWIGNGNFWSTDMVDYLVAWLNCAKGHGLTIDYLGGWNERGYVKSWYENLKNTLNAKGYGSVKVVADDASGNWNVANDVVSDPAFARSVDVIGTHYICGYRSAQTTCPSSGNARASGKVIWASENGSDDYNTGAQALARGINRDYIDGKATAYLNWPLVAAITPNLPYPTTGVAQAPQPWSGWYSIGKNAWVMAHTTQFTAPGWHYLDPASGFLGGNRANGSYVTLKSTNGADYSTVIETTQATASQTFTATVTGGLSTGAVHVWATNVNSNNPSAYLVRNPDITPSANGTFSLTLQPGYVYTLTTTTRGGKGTATSPGKSVMALPYTDSFDGYDVGREAKYLQDQQGAFEITACGAGRSGRCVRQMTAQAPINWANRSTPYALIGDVGWRDYTISTDTLLEKPGSVELIGRAGSQKSFSPNAINAYYLRVSDSGAWSILRNNSNDGNRVTLASGTVSALGTNRWHTLGLSFSGNAISAVIDGRTVRTVTDGSYAAGMAGYGTSEGETAQFDNLAITAGPGPGA
jgi:O-glycosyl hydrolase